MSSLAYLMQNYSDSEDDEISCEDKKLRKIKKNQSYDCNIDIQLNEISLSCNTNDQDFQLIKDYLDNEEYYNEKKTEDNDLELTSSYPEKICSNEQKSNVDLNSNQELNQLSPVSFHSNLIGLEENKVIIPQLPKDCICSNTLIDKITHLYNLMKQGRNMNETIQKKKSFRNPSIYEKLVAYCNLDEFGTNFPPEVYDPHCWDEEDYYEALSKKQKEKMEKFEKKKKEKAKCIILTGTAKKNFNLMSNSKEQQNFSKKTKWDIPTTRQN